jgi:hypothetical protein
LVQQLEMVRKPAVFTGPEGIATHGIENLPRHFTEHYNSLQTRGRSAKSKGGIQFDQNESGASLAIAFP